MRFIDFFAGIGGFRLGLEMAGHECAGHCEIVVCMEAALEKLDKPTQKIITEMAEDLARQLPNVSVSSALELLLGIGAMEGRG